MIKAIARWSVHNRVTVNMAMVLILVAGLISLGRMKKESFPEFSLDMIVITVSYPSASPEEIEEGIAIKIEEAIKSVDGVKKISSTATEGYCSVLVELESYVKDVQKVVDDIQTEVDRIETFPEEAKDPVVREIILREPVIYVALYGDVPEITLRQLAETVRDDLTNTNYITHADLSGARNYEISIEVSEGDLRRYGLTFDEVSQAVKSASLDLPAGLIKTASGELSLRTKGQRYRGEEFENIPLLTLADGTTVRLGNVAKIIDGFEDTDERVRFDGKPAILVAISKTKKQDLLKIADTVHSYVASMQKSLPPGIQMATVFDQSEFVRSRINLLLRNGVQGLTLVFITLAIFLQFNLAFWVTMGIPVSLMGAMWILGWHGDSINMISLFAFIMVLGLVVDDAIIVGENIFTRYSKGLPPLRACIGGTAQVGWPVIMTILTTVVAFLPLLFISGIMGKFIEVMPIAIIATLLFSLFEALFILPAHLADALERQEKMMNNPNSKKKKRRFRKLIENHLQKVINNYYSPLLRWVLHNRYISLSVAITIFIISLGLVGSGRVPFVFFPKIDSDWIVSKVIYPYGTPTNVTESALKQIEKAADELQNEYLSKSKKNNNKRKGVIRHIFTLVGLIMQEGAVEGEYGSHAGEIFVELVPTEERNVHYTKLLDRWRELTGEISGVEKLEFTTPVMGPGGTPIEMKLNGSSFEELELIAEEIKEKLSTYPGTFDISDDFQPGKPELKIKTKSGAKALGITLSDIAKQVRQGFYGDEALRIQRGKDDVKVMIRYTIQERRNRGTIDNMRIRTPAGNEVPFYTVAQVDAGRGYSVIRRVDRKRTITVSSDVDERVANAKKIVLDLEENYLPDLRNRHRDVSISFAGQEEQTQEAINSLKWGFLLALIAIYCLLATQFRSYIQPFIVMTAIPFGIIGAVFGHLVMGSPITLMSLFGIVALAGIVVNDSLVLIDFINQSRHEGVPIYESAYESGRARFRAVLLTSVTTFAGLFPILRETSFQAKFLIPMVISITFGLLFATVLTLLLVPSLYLILHDVIKPSSSKK